MSNAAKFQNALRIMWNLDRHELVKAGVFAADDDGGWKAFRDAPHNQAIRLDGERFERLWALIEGRQPDRHRKTHPLAKAGGES